MVAAGCEPIFDMTPHSAMLLGSLRAIGRGLALLKTSDQQLRQHAFDGAVVIDSPMLHLPLAARAHALDIPVMYYIAPQLWAWGGYRIHKLRNRTDRVAVILPFEEKFLRDQGVNATYVGHPLAERIAEQPIDRAVVDEIRARGEPVVALLPGSRRHVVREVLRGQLEVAAKIAAEFPGAAFGISIAGPQVAPVIDEHTSSARIAVEKYPHHYHELIQAADLVLVASGTTALEVAFHQRPMIVMYNASRLFYHLVARWIIHSRYLSLPNILADREVVPEFMPYYTSTTPIAERALELLRSDDARQKMVDELGEIVEPLRGTRASAQAATILLEMAARQH